MKDRLSGVRYNIQASHFDGRIYPPLGDRIQFERPLVRLLTSLGHRTLIGDNGSIEITNLRTRRIDLDKAGEDGRKVSDL